MINHHPYLDTVKVEEFYTEKDGVPVKYVCTSGRGESNTAGDIFFRETPHPEFGNRYFYLANNGLHGLLIGNADWIEDEMFDMIEGADGWEYSQHRHDYRVVGNSAIDGGRAYLRLTFKDALPQVLKFRVKDGEFVEAKEDSL